MNESTRVLLCVHKKSSFQTYLTNVLTLMLHEYFITQFSLAQKLRFYKAFVISILRTYYIKAQSFICPFQLHFEYIMITQWNRMVDKYSYI